MKKKNFIVGFSAAFAALIALASCTGIRAKDGVVLKIGNKEYTAEELFDDQKSAASAEAKFNAVYKVAVRRYFEEGQDGKQYMPEIERERDNKVSGSKAEAQSNASKNGTSYDTEWEKILKSNNVDDEAGLKDKFEYDLQKTKFEDVFYDKRFKTEQEDPTTKKKYNSNYDVLRQGGQLRDENGNGFGTAIDGYIAKKQPYHMKHILVKISGGKNTDDTSCTITKEEADKIRNIVHDLANGDSFEKVSDRYGADDTTARDNHSSLGIMSRDTSFVNDFKLGTYMYEAFFGSSTKTTAIDKLFPSDKGGTTKGAGKYASDIATEFVDPTSATADGSKGNASLGFIPYGEIMRLGRYIDEGGYGYYDYDNSQEVRDTFATAKLKKDDVNAKYYPRNVIFNKYFNKHNIMVITPEAGPDVNKASGTKDFFKTDESGNLVRDTTVADLYVGKLDNTKKYHELPGFKSKPKNNDIIKVRDTTNGDTVLRDENGRVIFVFRSGSGTNNSSNAESGYQGIHFVVIERSPFIEKETIAGYGDTSIDEYYTQYYPDQVGGYHPKYDNGTYKNTFTNFVKNSETSKYKAKADTVKSELKKADDNLNTYVYEYLARKGDIKFSTSANAKKIEDSINNWITITKRNATTIETDQKWDDTWESFYIDLQARRERRSEVGSDKIAKSSNLVPEIAFDAFTKAYTKHTFAELFGAGGPLHE